MRATGSHHSSLLATRATMAPSTRTLSASGSRKAPERVLPWRRAIRPSTASLAATTVHAPSVTHDAGSWRMRTTITGARRRRAAVRALAGVARADGPNEPDRGGGPSTDDVAISGSLDVGAG